jgi:hypothetical protein
MMKRLTAALLTLFALAGSFLPLAQAATLASNHACCLRKTAHPHQCHGSGPSDQISFSAANCCSHDCCKAVTASQSANPQVRVATYFGQIKSACVTDFRSKSPVFNPIKSRSSRAPPRSVLA